ncbi:MAG: DinB family protein [Anaerolineaceae bacterium]|nr:DinB family protein [Anaerolineaceae bacterium]
MPVDFTPVTEGNIKMQDFAKQFKRADLRRASDESLDAIRNFVAGLNDEQVTFLPSDPDAHDPYAVEGEEHIGWSLAHLVAHVTASSEEGAAFSSLLARGVPAAERPRYETPWREITSVDQCLQRIEESRRIRNAYLETWPDVPLLETNREMSERFRERFGDMNAVAAFLFGLMHEAGHYDQFREVRSQALTANR